MPTFPGSYIRSNLVLSRKQVEQIDEELRSQWRLFCPGSNDPRASAVFAKITDAAQERLLVYYQKRSAVGMSEMEDILFYDELSKPPFDTWICQSRRSFILDTIVAADTYITIFKPKTVLDIGTGFGFGAGVLARRHPTVNFTGIDRSGASIHFARDKSKRLKNLSYIQSDLLKFNDHGSYDLAITLAGIPVEANLIGDLISSTARLLNSKGVLLGYTTRGLASRRDKIDNCLGLVYKSVVGGFEQFDDAGKVTWQSAPFEVFQRGEADNPAYSNYDHNAEDWPLFANYVNKNIEDFDRQTFSYYRTV